VDTSSLCAPHSELRRLPFLTSLGCAIRRPSLRHTHFDGTLREKLGITGPLMIDSGGFALLMNQHANWTVRIVGDLIAKIEGQIFVSLDFPPHPKDNAELRRNKIRRSNRNFHILSDRFPTNTIMPVIHGRTIGELEYAVESLFRMIPNPKWIGLGGIVPLLKNHRFPGDISRLGAEGFIAVALRNMRKTFPRSKVHAFGAGGTRTFPAVFAFGADSADSIGWRQAAGYGSIFLPLKSQRVVRWNQKAGPPRKVLSEEDLHLLQCCDCPICRSVGTVDEQVRGFWESFEKRSIHNAWTIATQYKSWPPSREKMMSFISNGNLGSRWARATESVAGVKY
jgi:queuine/archaeosine tRNA-ribosyltransferase